MYWQRWSALGSGTPDFGAVEMLEMQLRGTAAAELICQPFLPWPQVSAWVLANSQVLRAHVFEDV